MTGKKNRADHRPMTGGNANLPIASFRETITTAVRDNAVVVITAETGAGKSTQVPQFLLAEGYDLVVTQPRRLAARSVATRVAEEMGVELGNLVGFRTAIERQDSEATRCLFCTDGLALVRELMGQNKGILVLDEVHEWNENMEVLVAWAKRQIEEGTGFKVVLMSATLEAEKLSAYFDDAPVISVPGRTFPVEQNPAGSRLEDDVARLLGEGRNVLVFQPGKAEIAATIDALGAMKVDAEIMPLHGQLTPEEQHRCFRACKRPKCVVSTNVAQTSVTIPDIDAVVDSGMERRIELVDGVEGLYLKPISNADATQRKGRAGRVKPGIYIDHCDASSRPDFPVAEILRKRLDQTVLRLAIAGFDMAEMDFFHQPAVEDIRDARRSLIGLGCMMQSGEVTRIGKLVNRLPISVQYARMLVEADRLGVVDDVLNVAAILEMGGITVPPPSRANPSRPDWRRMVPQECESDIMAQLAVWKMAESMTKNEMHDKGISIRNYFRAKEIRRHLAHSLERYFRFGSNGERESILKAVCAGMVDHLYEGEYGTYRNGDRVSRELGQSSVVRDAKWLVGKPFDLQIQTRRGPLVLRLIELASKVDPAWLTEVAPHLTEVKTGLNPRYNADKDVVVSITRTFFNGQQVREEAVEDGVHPESAKIFARWLCQQTQLLSDQVSEENKSLDDVLRSNAARQELARQLNNRTGEETFKIFSSDELDERFAASLMGARRIVEVVRPEALALSSLAENKIESVLRDNPDTIELLGSDLVVVYRPTDQYGSRKSPQVKLDVDDVKAGKWADLPDEGVSLPGGRLVEVVVPFTYYTKLQHTDVIELKHQVRNHLNEEQWSQWEKPVIEMPDPKVEGSEIPFVVAVYGQCQHTGKDLKAYGTVNLNAYHYYNSDPWLAVGWYRDENQARQESAKGVEKLQELKGKAQANAGFERRRQELERVRQELQDLRDHADWENLEAGIQLSVGRSLIMPRPSEESRFPAYKEKIEESIAQIKDALKEVEANRARHEAGEVILDFEAWHRRGGVSNNGDGWVIRPNGSLRDHDSDTVPRHKSDGTYCWKLVKPEELALRWRCGTRNNVAGSSDFEVVKLPVSGCTHAQLDKVEEIEQELGTLPNSFGLHSEFQRKFDSIMDAISETCKASAIVRNVPDDLDYLSVAGRWGKALNPGEYVGEAGDYVNWSDPFSTSCENREAQVVESHRCADGILELLAYEKWGGWNLNIRWRELNEDERPVVTPEVTSVPVSDKPIPDKEEVFEDKLAALRAKFGQK
jgi:HrpA-like RNA helicase